MRAARRNPQSWILRHTKLLRYLRRNHKLFSFGLIIPLTIHAAYSLSAFSSETKLWVYVTGIASTSVLSAALLFLMFLRDHKLALRWHAWIASASVLLVAIHTGGMVVVMALVVLIVLFLISLGYRRTSIETESS